jgi:protein-S-isoprenylcysteine O-methyltransferase Ste14
MARIAIFGFGILSYLVFLGVFLYAIGFVGGFWTPTTLDAAPQMPVWQAILIDLGLLAAFAVQHSGMARPAFKRWWAKILPPAAERSMYVLLSSLALVLLFVLWQPIGSVIWDAPDGWARTAVLAIYFFGWALLLYATFAIDHFELFGLTQVWLALRGGGEPAASFRTPALYRAVRHPIYVGWLIIFWAAPTMTAAHLVFAVMTTAYILIAIQLEERDLIAQFGDQYVQYRRRVPMLIPFLGKSAPRTPASAHD